MTVPFLILSKYDAPAFETKLVLFVVDADLKFSSQFFHAFSFKMKLNDFHLN